MSSRTRRNINPAFAPGFIALVDDVAARGMPPEARDVYKGRNRVAAFAAKGSDGRALRLNIKEFKIPNALNRWVYGRMRRSKARRAFDNALRLLDLGFETPEPVAWIERRDAAGRLALSYFISRQLDGWQEIRVAEQSSHPRMAEIAAGVGRLIFRLHHAGVWMKDASPGNILWHTDDCGRLHFALVDINRMDFGVRSRNKLMSNFGRLFAGESPTLAAARAYAAESGQDEAAIEREVLDQRRRAARKNSRKQRLKNFLKI